MQGRWDSRERNREIDERIKMGEAQLRDFAFNSEGQVIKFREREGGKRQAAKKDEGRKKRMQRGLMAVVKRAYEHAKG